MWAADSFMIDRLISGKGYIHTHIDAGRRSDFRKLGANPRGSPPPKKKKKTQDLHETPKKRCCVLLQCLPSLSHSCRRVSPPPAPHSAYMPCIIQGPCERIPNGFFSERRGRAATYPPFPRLLLHMQHGNPACLFFMVGGGLRGLRAGDGHGRGRERKKVSCSSAFSWWAFGGRKKGGGGGINRAT